MLKKISCEGSAKIRECESLSHFPPALNKRLSGEIGYRSESVVFGEDDVNGNIGTSELERRIDSFVTKYGSKFILAIIRSSSTWALITHLDVFF